MRDDFKAATKRLLASQVGYFCSKPDCRRLTIGPANNEKGFILTGVAAHITAAATGGPRHDSTISPEERSSSVNGVWLCEYCASLIDKDAEQYPVELLREWKQDATERAFEAIASGSGSPLRTASTLFFDETDQAFLAGLGLSTEDSIEQTMERMLQAAATDLATFRNSDRWPAHTIDLTLVIASEKRSQLDLEGLASGSTVAQVSCIVAPPGTGKSTTLIQAAEKILLLRQQVPLFIPLGEWSDRNEDFFSFLTRKNAFRALRREHFMQIAYNGGLVLLLDGWNELDPASRLRATRDLEALRREYPLIGTIIGTRRLHLPITATTTIEIEPLSEDQQRQLAAANRGEAGIELLDRLWRTSGVRELTSIPLYLKALLDSTTEPAIPETKEELLRNFIAEHEQQPDKALLLAQALQGFHNEILHGLAAVATQMSTTVLSIETARRTVIEVGKRLVDQGQLDNPLNPQTTIDALVNHHTLVRLGGENGSISFQHQQLQEWYASHFVERLISLAHEGSPEARGELRRDVLNQQQWEESVLFCCERMSRSGEAGAKAIAYLIRESACIDPIFSGQIIFRSSHESWQVVNNDIVSFALDWHTSGSVDRAFRFMITTGRPEFAELVWPLLSDANEQIHLEALRAAVPFRPSVLGADAFAHISSLPNNTRRNVISEIAENGGTDGMEFATELAMLDQEPEVVVAVIQSLDFRRGDQHINRILNTASDEVWSHLIKERYPRSLSDPILERRLVEGRKRIEEATEDSVEKLYRITTSDQPGFLQEIVELLGSPEFPIKADNARYVIEQVHQSHPQETAKAIEARIEMQLEVPYESTMYLDPLDPLEEGPVIKAVLDPETPRNTVQAGYALLGPARLSDFMQELLRLDQSRGEEGGLSNQDRETHSTLVEALSNSRISSFLSAIEQHRETDNPLMMSLLAEQIARHRLLRERISNDLSTADGERLSDTIYLWIEKIQNQPDSTRHQRARLAQATSVVPDTRFVPSLQELLETDLREWSQAKREYAERPTGRVPADVAISYMTQYARSLEAIGGDQATELLESLLSDEQFGLDAAIALVGIYNKENNIPSNEPLLWNDFSEAQANARERELGSPSTSQTADAIFDCAMRLGVPSAEESSQRRALQLAKLALGIPHGSRRAEIDQLLALPLSYSDKQALIKAAANAGERLSAEILLAGLSELVEEGAHQPWRLQGDRGEVVAWLELFPFSDDPQVVIDGLRLIPVSLRRGWQLRRLFSAIGNSPVDDIPGLLKTLAEFDPDFLDLYEWWNVLAETRTQSSGLLLLNLIREGTASSRHGMDGYHLTRILARAIQDFRSVRSTAIDLYKTLDNEPPRHLIESALAKASDDEIILALVYRHADEKRVMGRIISEAIENVGLIDIPSQTFPGAYHRSGVTLRVCECRYSTLCSRMSIHQN